MPHACSNVKRCSYAPYILAEKAHLFDHRRPESPCLFKPASAMVKGFPCRVRQEVVNANVAAIETKCTCLFSGVVAPRVHYKCRQHAGNIPATMACSLCVKCCRQSQLVRLSVADASKVSGRKIVKGTCGRQATATQRCLKRKRWGARCSSRVTVVEQHLVLHVFVPFECFPWWWWRQFKRHACHAQCSAHVLASMLWL